MERARSNDLNASQLHGRIRFAGELSAAEDQRAEAMANLPRTMVDGDLGDIISDRLRLVLASGVHVLKACATGQSGLATHFFINSSHIVPRSFYGIEGRRE